MTEASLPTDELTKWLMSVEDYDNAIDVCRLAAARIADLTADRDSWKAETTHWMNVADDLRRQLAEAREVKPHHAEMLAKEMQAIVAADRWKGRDLSAAPPQKWSHIRPETQQFWIDTAARILSALKGKP